MRNALKVAVGVESYQQDVTVAGKEKAAQVKVERRQKRMKQWTCH